MLVSASNVPSLLPGEKTTVTLALNPPANLPLTRYDGNLVLAGASTGVSVPFQFRALSEAVGDLNVSVTDEYTYYVADAPKVTNATVRVRDVISGNVVAQGRTGFFVSGCGVAKSIALPDEWGQLKLREEERLFLSFGDYLSRLRLDDEDAHRAER